MSESNLVFELRNQIKSDPEIDAQLDEFMDDEVIPEWVSNSPVDTGKYVDSIKVTKRAQGGKGQVGALSGHAHFVEYGTEYMKEYAVRARTEHHFNNMDIL